MGRVSCSDEFFIKRLISKKKKKRKKERKVLFPLLVRFYGSLSQKMSQKKGKKRVTPEWTDISSLGPVSFLSRSSMYYITLTLHNPINLLNVVSTNSFSWASNFTSLTAWCTNELGRLELAQWTIQIKIHLFFLPLVESLRIRK